MANVKQFDTWETAYDYCREANHPVIVRVVNDVEDETAKIFPSGGCKTLVRKSQDPQQPPR